MKYRYEYSEDAKEDLTNFNKAQIIQIEKAIAKMKNKK